MAQTKLWSVTLGRLADFDLEADSNGEIVATNSEDDKEFVKFPGGLTRPQFEKLVSQHNEANEGVKARSQDELDAESEARSKTEKLLESL